MSHRARRAHRVRRATGTSVACAAILAAVAAACTYGPPHRTQSVAGVVSDSTKPVVAILQKYHLHNPPTGLAAFPDGGVPRTIEEGVEVFHCDRASGRLAMVAKLVREREIRSEFEATPRGWRGDTLVVRLHGSTGKETGKGEIRIRYVGVLADGRVVPVAELAPGSFAAGPAGACAAVVDSLYKAAIRVSAPPGSR